MVEEWLDVLRGHTLTSFVSAPLNNCRLQWEIEMDGGRVFMKFEQARKDNDFEISALSINMDLVRHNITQEMAFLVLHLIG